MTPGVNGVCVLNIIMNTQPEKQKAVAAAADITTLYFEINPRLQFKTNTRATPLCKERTRKQKPRSIGKHWVTIW